MRIPPSLRRSTEWGSFALDFEAAGVGTCLVYTLFSATQLLDFEQPTIVRTHMKVLTAVPNTAGAGNIHEQLAIGIGVTTQEAITAGVTPCPYTNAAWGGWLLHWFSDLARENIGQGLSGAIERAQLDSEAMRKVQEGDGVFLAVQTPSTNVSAVNYSFQGRMLFKE